MNTFVVKARAISWLLYSFPERSGSPRGAQEEVKEEGRSVLRPSGAWDNTAPRCPRAYALG